MTVPVSGTVTSSYGMRTDPFTGEYRFHAGTDIGAQEGSAIAAALGGVVEEAGYSESYGYYLIVASSAQLKILYGHCSSLSVEKGDTVARGSKIAEVGSTGRSTGPHLHFEIRIGDSTIDPQTVINLQ